MLGLIVGVLLLVFCVAMLIFGFGSIGGAIGVIFVMGIAVLLIFSSLKKMVRNKKTSRHGEKCYGKILDCVKSGASVLNKFEYKIIASVYVPSLQKRLILEEIVGYDNDDEYPKDSYCELLYYNGDINVVGVVKENEVPHLTLERLNEEEVKNEYKEYKQSRKEKEVMTSEKAEKIAVGFGKAYAIYTIVGFYIFSLVLIFLTSYLSKMIELLKNISANFPLSLIYPAALIINLGAIVPMVLSPMNSKRRTILGILWFIATAFIMLQAALFNS